MHDESCLASTSTHWLAARFAVIRIESGWTSLAGFEDAATKRKDVLDCILVAGTSTNC